MSHSIIDRILRNFADKIAGIRGLTLISETGYPLTKGWGIDDSQPLITAGRMLETAMLFQEDYKWETVEHISIRAKEGYFSLIPCQESIFLLVYSTTQWTGTLEQEISQLVKQLQPQLAQGLAVLMAESEQDEQTVSVNTTVKTPEVSVSLFETYQRELAYHIGPIASIVCRRITKDYHSLTPSELINHLAQFITSPQQAKQFIESCVSLSFQSQELNNNKSS